MSTYIKHRFSDPRLPFIVSTTHYTPQNRDGSSVENWHENIEILLILDGEGIIRLDDRTITATKGDTVVVNHNVIHSITPTDEIRYHYIIVDRSFCVANHFDTSGLRICEYIRDAHIYSMFREIADTYYVKIREPWGAQCIRAGMLSAMTELCRKYSSPDSKGHEDDRLMSCIRQALGYINAECDRDISLDEISNFVGLSKYYFAREFKRVTGYTFVSYVNIARCEKAKTLLCETSESIGTVSASCGFSDQSYFTKVFKKHVGVLPMEFRQRKQ